MMKKNKSMLARIIAMLFISMLCPTSTQAMKRKHENEAEKCKIPHLSKDELTWDHLPPEIQQHILSFVADDALMQAPNLASIFNQLWSLRLISSECNSLITDQVLTNRIARCYLALRPEDSINEFLHACVTGNISLFKIFLDGKIDLDESIAITTGELEDNLEHFSFLDTCSADCLKRLQELLALLLGDRDAHEFERIGSLALILALSSDCHDMIKNLIDYDGDYLLACAVDNGDYPMAKKLVEYGANVNGGNDDFGPLESALRCAEGSSEMVDLLVTNGARFRGNPGITKYIEDQFDSVDLQELKILAQHLEATELPCHPLIYALAKNDIEQIKELLPSLNNIDDLLDKDKTLLEWAIYFENVIAVTYLLDQGATVYYRSDNRRFPSVTGYPTNMCSPALYSALEKGNIAIVKQLLDHVTTRDLKLDWYHPLDNLIRYVEWKNRVELIELLLLNGAEPNQHNYRYLLRVVRQNSIELASLLLKYGADVNSVDDLGNTALMYAVMAESKDMIKLLLENKADTTITNNEGLTPINYAVRHSRNQEIATLLLSCS